MGNSNMKDMMKTRMRLKHVVETCASPKDRLPK